MTDLTTRQFEIFEYIKDYLRAEGMPPTRAEIADAFEFKSSSAAQFHLEALVRKHVIRLLPGKSRGIQVCA